MERFVLNAAAGQISAELASRGIAADTIVNVFVEVAGPDQRSFAAIAQAGGGFDWLADEPDLYTENDGIAVRK
jgi:hypothetical protein